MWKQEQTMRVETSENRVEKGEMRKTHEMRQEKQKRQDDDKLEKKRAGRTVTKQAKMTRCEKSNKTTRDEMWKQEKMRQDKWEEQRRD